FWVSSLGQVVGALNPLALASRLGPRHCGQSCPPLVLAPSSTAQKATATVGFALFMVPPVRFLPPPVRDAATLDRTPQPGDSSNPPGGRDPGEDERNRPREFATLRGSGGELATTIQALASLRPAPPAEVSSPPRHRAGDVQSHFAIPLVRNRFFS